MRALFLAICALLILAFAGVLIAPGPAAVHADTRIAIQPGDLVAVGVNCRWLCVEGHGGPGEANVTGPASCAAACEAACGGAEFCRKATYIASAGIDTPGGN